MLLSLIKSPNIQSKNVFLILRPFKTQSIFRRFCHQKIRDYLEKFPLTYSQHDCEPFWTDIWHQRKLFEPKNLTESKNESTFRMLLPPPNITGSLHLGHSLTVAIQDSICRFNRMNGKNVSWYGGTDHAGIATQIVVEKLLWAKQGKTRHEVTREEFGDIFEKWKTERIQEIQDQLKSLGASIDFNSNYFTLSPEMSDAVNEAFIRLFNQKMIQRQSYMVNWSYYLQTTLSDIEIEHRYISKPTLYQVPGCEEKFLLGVLHYFKYPIDSLDSNEFVTIATTRIESLMGDVALCVNPNDSRYSHLIGRYAVSPFTNIKMPIIADDIVKPEFGTGVLKVTPAHSIVDFEIAQRHNLPIVSIFNEQGFIDCSYELFNNMHRYTAKDTVQKELERLGLYEGHKEHPHWLPICSRSGDIIENKVVPQWFLKCDDARYITEYVVNRDNLSEISKNRWNELKKNIDSDQYNMPLIPSSYRNTWKDWFSRYKDWCISRQIFWGHRIPAYEIFHNSKSLNEWVAAKSPEEALKLAQKKYPNIKHEIDIQQDKDVLDTWFSSGLLPLAVTGFFEGETYDNAPLSLMETGHDIIFFWVARMTMLSFLLANKLPFQKVLLHGMICDANGKKMSKSKGNVVDPMHLINGASLEQLVQQIKEYLHSGLISEEMFTQVLKHNVKAWPKGWPVCGADILRLSLLQSDFKEQKVNFDLSKTIKKRAFSNKMHQTVRFVMLNLNENFKTINLEECELSNLDKWILTKLSELIHDCRMSFESFDIHKAVRNFERFWTNHLCDTYIEIVKKNIFQPGKDYIVSMNVLIEVIRKCLLISHPIMPFITEDLYQKLELALAKANKSLYQYESILEKNYPSIENDSLLKKFDQSFMSDLNRVFQIQRKIRWFKQSFFINREPLIQKIRIASLIPNLAKYKVEIEQSIKMDDCDIEFVNLYDVYKYDSDSYCVQINVENDADSDSSSDSDNEIQSISNSLNSDEIYLIFTLDRQKIQTRLNESKLRLSASKIESVLNELDRLDSKRFTENYKKSTKIIS